MAALVVPLVISFGAPFSIALGRKPAAGDDYASFTAGLFAGHVVIEFDRRQRLRPGRFHAARRLPLLRPADARAVRPHGEPRRSRRPRHRPAAPQAGRPRGLGRAARSRRGFVLERLRRGPPLSPAVASAYRELAFCHGNVRIETIAARLDWSRKHLSQRFQEEIGLPPKALARMLALQPAARSGARRRRRTGPGWPPNAAMPTRRI